MNEKVQNSTPIKNDVLQALISSKLNGVEMSIALLIYRKTVGWNKKSDLISLSQFTKLIPVSKRAICYAIERLKLVKIIALVKRGNNNHIASEYSFNGEVGEWQPVKKFALVQKKGQTSAKYGKKLVNKTSPTKETTKETIQKKEDGFIEFWGKYPKKQKKKNARSSWDRIPQKDYQAIMKGLESHKKSKQWLRDNGEFVPHPTSFLNQRRWEDKLEVEVDSTAARHQDLIEKRIKQYEQSTNKGRPPLSVQNIWREKLKRGENIF